MAYGLHGVVLAACTYSLRMLHLAPPRNRSPARPPLLPLSVRYRALNIQAGTTFCDSEFAAEVAGGTLKASSLERWGCGQKLPYLKCFDAASLRMSRRMIDTEVRYHRGGQPQSGKGNSDTVGLGRARRRGEGEQSSSNVGCVVR